MLTYVSFKTRFSGQIIKDLRNQVTDLEAEKIAQLPPDAQETIQTYRDRSGVLFYYCSLNFYCRTKINFN